MLVHFAFIGCCILEFRDIQSPNDFVFLAMTAEEEERMQGKDASSHFIISLSPFHLIRLV